MAKTTKIKNEIENLKTLRLVSKAYAEIAAMRMQNIRESVLKSREFTGSLDNIFSEVIKAYKREVEKLLKNAKNPEKITFLAHNGKKVIVFISANTGLYGDIIGKVFSKFIEEVDKNNAEVAIIGKLGQSLFEQARPNNEFTYFDFPDFGASARELSFIIQHIVSYEEINVFYGKFLSVVTQTPDVYKISAVTPKTIFNAEGDILEKYLFEPELADILQFFEKEIFSSIFDQTMRESQLAKFASRINAMSRAEGSIGEKIGRAMIEDLKFRHSILNRKQLNSLSGLLSR